MSNRTKRDIFFYGCMTGLFLAVGLAASIVTENWAWLATVALGLVLAALLILLIHALAAVADRLWRDDQGISG